MNEYDIVIIGVSLGGLAYIIDEYALHSWTHWKSVQKGLTTTKQGRD
jgi:hypothetical protein